MTVGNEIISCQGHNSSEYHTLAYYLNHSSKYFKSYQTYVFEDGNHTPTDNSTLIISGVIHLTLIGEGVDTANSSRRAVVDCNGRANSFEFKQSSNIVLQSITFTSCVSQHTIYRSDIGLATLVFVNGTNLFLLSVSIIASEDEALLILNVGGSVIINDTEIANSRIVGKAVYQSGNGITYRNCHSDSKPAYIYIMNSRFINNSNVVTVQQSRKKTLNAGGLSIDLKCPNVRVVMKNVTMSNNIGNVGGNLGISFQIYLNVSVEIIDSQFEGGNSPKGGGMFVALIEVLSTNTIVCEANMKQIKNRLLHIHNTNFSNNIATKYGGGGVFIKHMQSFPKCSIIESIIFENVTFNDNSVNSTDYGGGIALHSINFMVTNYVFHENPQFQVSLNDCRIYSNHVQSLKRGDSGTGAIFVNSNLYFQLSNTAIFNNYATGIVGMNSNIILSNNISIVNNHGTSGGGMLLCQNAAMYLEAHTNVTIERNSADNTGGGICVETSDYIESQEICFFQFGYQIFVDPSLSKTITVSLHNNEARLAGNNVFGGSIDQCYMIHGPNKTWAYESTKVFHNIFKVPKNKLPLYSSSISSPPRQVCSCQNDKIDCKTASLKLQKFPGETFFIDAVLVGQFQGTVPGTVRATLQLNNSSLQQGEYVQNLSSIICSRLRYTVNTNSDYEIVEVRVQHVGGITGFERTFQKYSIHVEMKDCPLGFTRTNASCACNWLLTGEYVSCDITTQTIRRLPPIWIGTIDKNGDSKIIAFHGNCPFDYCVTTEINLFSTNNSLSQNEQCAFNRTGILCGLCAEGLSNIFGSSECRSCSNYWLLLFIPLALIGVAFLIVLIVFNVTIAEGTLSGIVFYCNIVMSNISILFPSGQGKYIPFLTSFLKLFLSLINLEIGIPVCFYNGMNSYIKAWLDFVFPLYLWFLTGVFIFLGGRCSWIVRHNAVKVLATLILLSYTRLLNSIAAALQATHIQLDSGGTEIRWLIDGNIKFFGMKHFTLAVFAILLGLLLLPFALSLFSIQWLQKVSNRKLFSWVYRLKPFFDVYTGPFTSSGRFWTGLLLLTRVALHIITAVNVAGDPKAVLGATTIAVLLLFLAVGFLPARLYRRKYLNVLEYLSLINLGILASLLIIFTDCTIISHVSVCIELLILTGVAVSHFIKVRKRNRCCIRLKRFVPLKLISLPGVAENVENIPPNYYYEDREPLLADEEH